MPDPTDSADSEPAHVTRLLQEVRGGDDQALQRLLDAVYRDLRAIGEKQLSRERAGHTLQPTALVHEAYLRLIQQEQQNWQNRAHFFAIAARIVRRVLVDHARAKQAIKRDREGADLEQRTMFVTRSGEIDVLDLEEALEALTAEEPEIAKVVEMRFFGELTTDEIAEVLGVSDRTVRRHWNYAKAWLHRALAGGEEGPAS